MVVTVRAWSHLPAISESFSLTDALLGLARGLPYLHSSIAFLRPMRFHG